jgi:hypothetical protein
MTLADAAGSTASSSWTIVGCSTTVSAERR